MSDVYVADTMAIVLFLEKRKLPLSVKNIFANALAAQCIIYFSAVSLMEIGYLSERLRIDVTLDDVLFFVNENKSVSILNLDAEIIKNAFQIDDIPELHDRLIAGSASTMNAKLITNDPLIQQSKQLNTIW